MNKKNVKILVGIVLTIVCIGLISSVVFAASSPNGINISNSSELDTIGGKIIGLASSIGMIISVLALIIMGIKYIMGSVEEKAEYKKTMIPYLIGAIFIFAASSIAQVVYNAASQISV